MNTNVFRDPAYYRKWAEEVRVLMGTMNNIETRAQMARLADDYDRLAERAEKHAHDKPAPDQ